MKQLGNLAIVCAKRQGTLLQVYNGHVCVHVGKGMERTHLVAKWDDDETISTIIQEINFGKYDESREEK